MSWDGTKIAFSARKSADSPFQVYVVDGDTCAPEPTINAVPTLELKISFLEAAGPGFVTAEGRVLRWGGSVGFLDGDIKDDKGRVVVHATSTIKIVRPRK